MIDTDYLFMKCFFQIKTPYMNQPSSEYSIRIEEAKFLFENNESELNIMLFLNTICRMMILIKS